MWSSLHIKEGEMTSTIYGMIRDGRYTEAVQILNNILQTYTNSRAAISLLGYCHYQLQQYDLAADCYEQLTFLHPEVTNYKVAYCQALVSAGHFEEAMKMAFQIEDERYAAKVLKIQMAVKYHQDDLVSAKSLVENNAKSDPDADVNIGCILFKEGNFEGALKMFNTAMQVLTNQPHLLYDVALCHYKLKQYDLALKPLNDIIERGIREHPELGIGLKADGVEVRSVGNTLTLNESALVEAFNLKAAIEYQLKRVAEAAQCLVDMPPRSEEELDPVTLHNIALTSMGKDPTLGFQKLQFLLQQPSFPAETFCNLLLLYIKFEHEDLAADIMAENAGLAYKYLSPFLIEFIEGVILSQTAAEEASKKYDEMSQRFTEQLRKLQKQFKEEKTNHNHEEFQKTLNEYNKVLEGQYIPVVMQQAKLYWDLGLYSRVEKIFSKSEEFCKDNDTWRLNMAHVLYMQGNKYKEAAGFYEPVVKKHYKDLFQISAIVLANMCVCFILINQNERAEDLLKKIEKEEEQLSYETPDKKLFHLCIVNLVIGTLYCSKGNFDFGISRIMKSMTPYQKKLGTETWFYTKRCFIAMFEMMSKQAIVVEDSVLNTCNQFLEHCEHHGQDVKALNEQPLAQDVLHLGRNTVTFEARQLKALLLEVLDN